MSKENNRNQQNVTVNINGQRVTVDINSQGIRIGIDIGATGVSRVIRLNQTSGVASDAENAEKLRIKRFSSEQKELLRRKEFLIYTLTGVSVDDLGKSGRRLWIPKYLSFPETTSTTVPSQQSEVAVNPDRLYMTVFSSNPAKQKEKIRRYSEDLRIKAGKEGIVGLKAVIGNPSDYAELACKYLDDRRDYLFGSKYISVWEYAEYQEAISLFGFGTGGFVKDPGYFLVNKIAIRIHNGKRIVPLIVPV